jgi:hypothetical protein
MKKAIWFTMVLAAVLLMPVLKASAQFPSGGTMTLSNGLTVASPPDMFAMSDMHDDLKHVALTMPFEGTITLTTTGMGDDSKHDVLINMKGSQIQIDIDAGAQGHFQLYPDAKKNKLYIVMTAQHMGLEQTLTKHDTKVELKSLGKKDTIAGHPAEAYELVTAQADVTLWEASDLPSSVREAYLAALPHILQEDNDMSAALDQLGKKNMAPVRVDLAVKEMGQKISLELVKVEPKKMDDALFVLPKDITFQPMPQMGGGNPGGGGGDAH